MKVSLQSVKEFSSFDPASAGVDDLVRKVGAQLGEVDDVVDYRGRYDGVVVARVVTCRKHSNADKLTVCEIDDAGAVQGVERIENGMVQVVCGAPNVREGLLVAWIPPGVTVPATVDKDPFVLEAKELRGVVSNGMLASASELGISSDLSGLLEINPEENGAENARPGLPFRELYKLDDVIIDIENKMFTHRPDCFGVLGVARELAGIYGSAFHSPDWYVHIPEFLASDRLQLEVENREPELVPRFMAVALEDVVVRSSPVWLQALLTRIGMKPINNVVDVTNYLSYITGQPLHAYDYDKVSGLSNGTPKLIIRKSETGETIPLLNGKTVQPREQAIVIASEKSLLGIGGVMGGVSTEVDTTTTRVILECANFDMYSIRRTSMTHGLFTDAVTRFTKGQSSLQCDRVFAEAIRMSGELAGAVQASNVIDVAVDNPYSKDPLQISTTDTFIHQRLGITLRSDEIAEMLRNVEFSVETEEQTLRITVPFWRTDIHIAEDIVEEIIRLKGYDSLPAELPKKKISPAETEKSLQVKRAIRRQMAALGANEVLTYSFVNSSLLKKAGQDPHEAFRLTNAISPDLEHYRLSLTPSLLQLVHPNIKAGYDEFVLFEIGKVHGRSELGGENIPKEFGRIAAVVAARTNESAAFYRARLYADLLIGGLTVYEQLSAQKFQDHALFQQMLAPFQPERSALVNDSDGKLVGIVGEFKRSVIREFKLPEHTAGFELFLSSLESSGQTGYMPLSHYPSLTQDMCLQIDRDMPFSKLSDVLREALKLHSDEAVADVELIDIFASDDVTPGKKRITFRMKLTSYDRTLTESFANSFMQHIEESLSSKIGAIRI